MFNSLKLEQMIDFVLKVRLKFRAQKERHKRERERERERETERERGDNSLYPVLHLSLKLSFLLQSEVIKQYNFRLL